MKLPSKSMEKPASSPMISPSLPFEIHQEPSHVAYGFFIDNVTEMSAASDTASQERPRFPDCLHSLCPVEREMLYELWEASTCMVVIDEEIQMMHERGFDPSNVKLTNDIAANLLEECHKKLIRMCKKLSFFAQLSEEDQISLIRGGLGDIYFIFHLQGFDRDKRMFQYAPYNRNLGHWKINFDEAKDLNPELFELVQRFLLTFDPAWQNDKTMIAILMAISLFTPRDIALKNFIAIEAEHERYKNLLKNYLSAIHKSKAKADYVAESLLLKLHEMRQFQITPQEYVIQSARNVILPLLYELFVNQNVMSVSLD